MTTILYYNGSKQLLGLWATRAFGIFYAVVKPESLYFLLVPADTSIVVLLVAFVILFECCLRTQQPYVDCR